MDAKLTNAFETIKAIAKADPFAGALFHRFAFLAKMILKTEKSRGSLEFVPAFDSELVELYASFADCTGTLETVYKAARAAAKRICASEEYKERRAIFEADLAELRK